MEKVVKFLKDAGTYFLPQLRATSQEYVLSEQHIFLRAGFTFRQARKRTYQSSSI